MLYHAYEMTHAAFTPMRAVARMGQGLVDNPLNPMSETYGNRAVSAALDMFIHATRRYGKPAFELPTTLVEGVETPVVEEFVWSRPFCNLLHFRRESAVAEERNDPRLLIVAPRGRSLEIGGPDVRAAGARPAATCAAPNMATSAIPRC